MLDIITQNPSTDLDLDIGAIRKDLDDHGYAVVRGVFKSEDVVAARQCIEASFDVGRDVKHDPRDIKSAKKNLQKMIIGGSTSGSPRFVRKYYNPLFNEDIWQMHSLFKTLVEFRNLIYGKHRAFAMYEVESGAWTCPMVAHYPRGGGFMAQHKDSRAHQNAVDLGMNRFIQVILIMSQKGKDFQTGGAYLLKDKQRIFFEDKCIPGDVVMYDGRIEHGVEEIDTLEPLDLSSPAGRYVAMAPLFKDLKSFDELLEVGRRARDEKN